MCIRDSAIEAFDDAADFQWLYVPQDYDVALADVRAEVVLPVAADDSVKVMENVYAWGHGPADGAVDIRSDGTVIFTDPAVEPTMYAKARVMSVSYTHLDVYKRQHLRQRRARLHDRAPVWGPSRPRRG